MLEKLNSMLMLILLFNLFFFFLLPLTLHMIDQKMWVLVVNFFQLLKGEYEKSLTTTAGQMFISYLEKYKVLCWGHRVFIYGLWSAQSRTPTLVCSVLCLILSETVVFYLKQDI